MKKPPARLRFRLAVAAALAACAAPATAGALPPAALDAVRALAAQAAAALAPAGMRVEVVPGELDPRLKLAPCARVEPYLPPGMRPWGRARIGVRCRDGAVAWNVYLPVTVRAWGPGLVVTEALPAGATLGREQLAPADVDWAAAPTPPLATPEALVGRTLARPLAAGDAPRLADLKPREWFGAGETVTIVARGDGYLVTAQGEALMRGFEGRPVRVRTDGGRLVTGWPSGERRVDLNP